MEKPLGCYFQVRPPHYQAEQCNQKKPTYSCVFKVTDQVRESGKKISINTGHSYTSVHFPKPVSTDLKLKSDSVLTNPIGKDVV